MVTVTFLCFLQHIVDQLEYRPIKRRLEAGSLAWTWANQDDDLDVESNQVEEQQKESGDNCNNCSTSAASKLEEEAVVAPKVKKHPPKPGSEARVRILGFKWGSFRI